MLKGKIKDQSDRTVWAEYRDGFQIQIRYVPRAKLQRMLDRCQKREWDPKDHQLKDKLDNEKFYRMIAEEVVVGWRGLTPDVLRKMADMEEYPEEEVPYSVDDAAELLDKAYDFDLWVQRVCSDLEYFDASRRASEEKNS